MTDSSAIDTHASPFSTRTLHLVFLLICGCLLLMLGLGDVGLTDRDEGSNAGAAREMLETGDWISPTLNYEPRYAKPALTYWIIAGTYALFGVNDFTARLPSAVFGLALLVLHYLFLHRLLGPALAFCGSLILLLNVEFVGIHRMVLTDPALVFFTTLATYGFWLGFCDPESRPAFPVAVLSRHGAGHVGQGTVGHCPSLVGHRALSDPHPAVEGLFRRGPAAGSVGPSVFSLPRPGTWPCSPSTARIMPPRPRPIPPDDSRIPWRGTAGRCCFISPFSCSAFSRGVDCSRRLYGTC